MIFAQVFDEMIGFLAGISVAFVFFILLLLLITVLSNDKE